MSNNSQGASFNSGGGNQNIAKDQASAIQVNETTHNIDAKREYIEQANDVYTGPVIQHNYYGYSKEEYKALTKELAVTEFVVERFFESLEKQKIPRDQWDSKLQEIATQYKELLQRLEFIQSEDPQVIELKTQARQKIEDGDYEQAEALLNQADQRDAEAIAAMEVNLKKRQLSRAETNADNGQLQLIQLQYAKAAEYYQKAVNIMPEGHDGLLAEYLHWAGYALYEDGKYPQSQQMYERALTLREAALGKDHPHVATTLNNLAGLYRAMGQYEQALPLYERDLRISEAALGKDHPHVATTYWNIGLFYAKQGNLKQAERYISRTVEIEEKIKHQDLKQDRAALEKIRELLQQQENNTQHLQKD